MNSKIQFGETNKLILIPIIGGIIKIIYRFLIIQTGPSFGNHPFVFSSYSSLGMCLAFIRYIKEPDLDELMPENDEAKKKIKKGKIIFICIAILLDFMQTVIATFFYVKTKLNLWNFDIIILGIFSRIILKISLNRHQFVSIVSIFILSLIMNLVIVEGETDSYFNILSFVCQIILDLQVVIHKLIIENYASTPSEICFCEGVVNLFLYILFLSIFSNIKIPEEYNYIFNNNLLNCTGTFYLDNFPEYVNKINIKEIFVALGFLILNGILNLIILTTIKLFTPFHFIIVLVIGEFEKILYEYDKWKTYIELFIVCIIFFMILIFNEIIELHFFDLSQDIKRYGINRANDELTESIASDDEDEDIDLEGIN